LTTHGVFELLHSLIAFIAHICIIDLRRAKKFTSTPRKSITFGIHVTVERAILNPERVKKA
jgi:hypothetical protein